MTSWTLEEWIYLLLAIIGVAIALWWNFRDAIQLKRKGQETEGRIINWMMSVQKGKKIFHPLIEFQTVSGVKITFKADENCENEPKYPVGTIVTITYAVNNPDNRKIKYP